MSRSRDLIDPDETRLPGSGREELDPDTTRLPPTTTGDSDATVLPRAPDRGHQRFMPDELRNDYEYVSDLGQGGQGAVVLARDRASNELVAIKIVAPNPAFEAALLAIQSLVPVEHAVRTLGVGSSAYSSWHIMEYISGGSLEDLVHGGPPPDERAVDIVRELATAIDAFNAAGIPHPDVKPPNILIRTTEPQLDLVLVDFHGAQQASHSVIARDHGLVSHRYSAPEAHHSLGGHRTPWWSLGVIVAEIVGGRHPWATETGDTPEPEFLSDLMSRVPPTLDHLNERWELLCRGLLLRDPANRWGNQEVTAWLAGDSPPIVPDIGTRRDLPPIPFILDGRRFANPREFAQALATEPETWAVLIAMINSPMESQGFVKFRTWIGDTLGPTGVQVVDEGTVTGGRSPSARLLRLLRMIDSELPPSFEGRAVDAQCLADDARVAESELGELAGAEPIAERCPTNARLERLFASGCLYELAGFSGGEDLNRIEDAWQRLLRLYRSVVRPAPAELSSAWAIALARVRILRGVADPKSAARYRKAAQAARRDRMALREDWFATLAKRPVASSPDSLPVELVLSASVELASAQARATREEHRQRAATAAIQRRAVTLARTDGWIPALMVVGVTTLLWPWLLGAWSNQKSGWFDGALQLIIIGGGLLTGLSLMRGRWRRRPGIGFAVFVLIAVIAAAAALNEPGIHSAIEALRLFGDGQ